MKTGIIESITPEAGAIVADAAEAQLVSEVGTLWQVHSDGQTALHKTREELRTIRASLAQRLYELKSVLSRPGRGGAWSSFLESQRIPRSTADRLCRAHERCVATGEDNCTTEQFSEPTEVTVKRYFRALWPKLSRILSTPEAVQIFIAELVRATTTNAATVQEATV